MAALPPEALGAGLVAAMGAAHKTGLNTDPNAATASSGGGGASAPPQDPSAQDPNAQQDPNADPNAQGGADAQHQAVWQMFPSTDPGYLQGLISQGGDPEDALNQFAQQRETDASQFNQMQDALFAHLAALFSTPTGGGLDQGAAPPQSPGVGGAGSGY